MNIVNTRLLPNSDGSYTLEINVGIYNEEFASELGQPSKTRESLLQEVKRIAKQQYPNFKISTIKVLAGVMLIGVINTGIIGKIEAQAEESTYQVVSGYPTITHTVKSGDTLSVIARNYNVSVTDLKDFNGLKSDVIYVGQVIKIPYYSYFVVGGDTLSLIAKKFNSTVTAIKDANKLTTDQIYIGQKLLIPVAKTITTATAPTTTTPTAETSTSNYTVITGDSLSLIAKKYATTIENLQKLNNLTTTVIYPGQVLKVPTVTTTPSAPTTEQPPTTIQETVYTVVSGDTLSLIAKKFNVTVDGIKSANKLSSDVIYVGQKLTIPTSSPTTTEPAPPVIDQPTETTSYTVVLGDSLSIIANRHNTTVTAIKELNNLQSDMIYVGQKLIIPKVTVTVDQTPPATPTIEPLQIIKQTNVSTYEIKGKTEAGAKVSFTATDQAGLIVKAETTANSDGSYVFKQGFTSLQDGTITIEVVATDAAGNKSTEQKTTVTKDVLAPTNLQITSTEMITNQNDTAFSIAGTVTGASKVKLEITDAANKVIRDELTITNNTYQKAINLSTLSDGNITVKAIAIDANGNESPLVSKVITKDTVAPNVPTLAGPTFINNENQHEITLTGTTEPNATVSLTINDKVNSTTKQTTANANGNYTFTIDARIFNEGPISFTANSKDAAGNESEAKSVQITKDVTVNELVLGETNDISLENAGAYTISGKGEPNTKVVITAEDSSAIVNREVQTDEDGNFTTTLTTDTLKDGVVTLLAYQTDEAGNKSVAITKVIQKDTTAPTVVSLNPLSTLTQENTAAYTLSGAGEPLSTITATITDVEGKTVTQELKVAADGTFRTKVDLTGLKGDELSVSLLARDKAGNSSEATTATIAVDQSGPQTVDASFLPNINRDNAATYSISGVTEPNASIEFEFSDGTTTIISQAKADENGNFSTQADLSRLLDGTVTGLIKTKDANHNAGVTKEISISKDTVVTDPASVVTDNAGKVSSKNASNYEITGTSKEEGATVTIEVSDGTTIVKETALVVDGKFQTPLNLTELSDGTLTVTVTQQDIAGNTSEETTTTIEKDTVANQPVIQMSKLTRTSSGYTYTIQGIGEPNSKVTVNIAGQSNPVTITKEFPLNLSDTFTATVDVSSLNGQKPFITVTQVDSFGNESKLLIAGISTYVVGSGDTLWKISTVLGTTVDELRSLNQLTSDMVYIGQQLKVPLVAGLTQEAISEEQSFNMGYLYHGSSNTYMETMQYTQGSINVISPTYFDINADGTLKLTQVVDRYFIANMQANGIRVVPFLSNHWDRATGERALQNREVLTDQIAEAVRIYNLDGVNIDIENVTHEYRDEYSDFARLLREKIPADKEVSVAVAANPSNWTTGWHGSYDYTSLSQSSDYLMIMAYDESYTGSKPGPVASIQFVEKSIQYAIDNGVPKEKIVLGIGHYGRYWVEGASVGGNAISNQQVAEAVKLYNGVVTFDQVSMSPKATFTIKAGDPTMSVYGVALKPGNYTVWFENEQSMKAKFDLVEKYGIKGTGNWGVEMENREFWTSFSDWQKTALPVNGEVEGS